MGADITVLEGKVNEHDEMLKAVRAELDAQLRADSAQLRAEAAQWRNDDAQLAQRLEDMAAQMQRTQRRAQAAFAAMCAAGPPSPPRKPLSAVN